MPRNRRKKNNAGQIEPVQHKQPQIAATFEIQASRESTVSFSGPLPPPEILHSYNVVVPGAAERIVAMADRQSVHRQDLEKIVVKGNSRQQAFGTVTAFLLSLMVVAAGTFLIYNDKDVTGFWLIVADLAALAGVFVYGRRSQSKERLEKLAAIKE